MINSILNGLIEFFTTLLNILLLPLDTAIQTFLPDFSDVLSLFNDFVDQVLGFFPWILSWFNIPDLVLTLAVGWIIGKISISIAVYTIKLVVAWWDRLVA